MSAGACSPLAASMTAGAYSPVAQIPGGPVAVVRKMKDGRHGVRVICTRAAVSWVTLAPAEWRALIPAIEAACALAETPGRLPGDATKTVEARS